MKYLLHLKTIIIHKWYVGLECFKHGLYWQGIVHDLSKFSYIEFFYSAQYFNGTSTPIGREKAEKGYSLAWLNHKAKNKHHWEYWTDFYSGVIKPVPIPEKYIKEMACDMIGASKTYNKMSYRNGMAWEYFNERRDQFIMTDESKTSLEKYLCKYEALDDTIKALQDKK